MFNRFRPKRGPRAFTLVELLVVIAIIGILIALLLPAVQAAREAARRSECTNNLKQLALAVHNHHDSLGRLPYNGSPVNNAGCCNPGGNPEWSWIARSLPYFEQGSLYEQLRISENSAVTITPNRPYYLNSIPALRCPSDDSDETKADRAQFGGSVPLAASSYKGVAGSNWAWGSYTHTPPGLSNNGLDDGNGMFFRSDVKKGNRRLALVTDGTSNTLMIGEDIFNLNTHCGWAYSNHATGTCSIPLNNALQPGQPGYNNPGDWPNVYSFRSRHPGGANFALVDGSVTFIPQTIDLTTYRALASRAGGESVSVP